MILEYILIQIVHNVSNFHPLEVVGRGSETQLQVGENFFFQYNTSRVTML